jgi:predicted TIM-barrel fold metal-dependent hydrolase
LIKPNVYADFSAQTFLRSSRALSEVLREWLEWYPEKVLFGTDAYSDPGTPLSDWEEKTWLTTTSAREALGIALTGMMRDREITRGRALELARLVLRDNANRLYRFSER